MSEPESHADQALRIGREMTAMQAEDMARVRKAQAEHDAEIAVRGTIRDRMRDSFAQTALNGLLAGRGAGPLIVPDALAEMSYTIAEAMLAEREKRSSK